MSQDLLKIALTDPGIGSLEHIDVAPLDALEHLLAAGPAAGVHTSRLHAAGRRRAYLTATLTAVPLPDKADLLARVVEEMPALLADLREKRRGRGDDTLPDMQTIRAAFECRPCAVVEEGALLRVERRVRLHGTETLKPISQGLHFVSAHLKLKYVLRDPRVWVLPIVEGLGGKLWRAFGGQGVGATLRREMPSVRAQHLRMGLHAPERAVDPSMLGEEVYTVIDCA